MRHRKKLADRIRAVWAEFKYLGPPTLNAQFYDSESFGRFKPPVHDFGPAFLNLMSITTTAAFRIHNAAILA